MRDELNPAYLFQGVHADLLAAIANGKIDPAKIASKELASRGLDSTGKWVTFEKANELHLARVTKK